MLRDQRNLRNKDIIQHNIQAIRPYCPNLGDKQLRSPTMKEFTQIFQTMYKQLNPLYQYKKRIQEDMLVALKQLKYPNIDQLKQHLNSPGASQSWPYCLAMLVWIHELILVINEQVNDQDPTVDYMINVYQDFIQGEDDFSSHFNQYQSKLLEANNVQHVHELQQYNESLKSQIQQFSPELPKYKEQQDNLKSDLNEFQRYMQQLSEKEAIINQSITQLNTDLTNKQQQLETLDTQLSELEILPSHDHLIQQRDTLLTSLDQTQKMIDQKTHAIWELEIQLQKVTDQLDLISQAYMQSTYSLPNPKPIAMNYATGQVEGPISLDAIFQEYSNYKLQLVNSNHVMQEQITTLTEQIDKIMEHVTEMTHDMSTIQDQLKHSTQHYQHHRQNLSNYTSQLIEQLDHLDSCLLQQKQSVEEKLLNQQQTLDLLQRKKQKLESYEMNTTALFNGVDSLIEEKSQCEKITNDLVKEWGDALRTLKRQAGIMKEMMREKKLTLEE